MKHPPPVTYLQCGVYIYVHTVDNETEYICTLLITDVFQ